MEGLTKMDDLEKRAKEVAGRLKDLADVAQRTPYSQTVHAGVLRELADRLDPPARLTVEKQAKEVADGLRNIIATEKHGGVWCGTVSIEWLKRAADKLDPPARLMARRWDGRMEFRPDPWENELLGPPFLTSEWQPVRIVPDNVDEVTLAVGDGRGKLFVHGSYEAVKECQRKMERGAGVAF